MKSKNAKICDAVREIYSWLDAQIKLLNADCSACGNCCNFETFGHKLFITSPELLYFYENLKPVQKMTAGRCPYQKQNQCTARESRFAGCRIFFCKADSEKINELSEQTIKKFKSLCHEFDFPYRYVDLTTALNSPELLKMIEK